MCVAVSSWSCIQYFYSALEQTEEKRRLKTMEKKSINLFYRSNLLCFYLTSFFCKIDLGLDTISFLERLLKVCDSQNSQFFDPSSTVLYILYNCEWVWTNFLLYLFWNILYILVATLHLSEVASILDFFTCTSLSVGSARICNGIPCKWIKKTWSNILYGELLKICKSESYATRSALQQYSIPYT